MHQNTASNQLRHLSVLQQQRGGLCGFHMYFNAKCLVRAILAQHKFTQLDELLKLNSCKHFWSHHKHCLDLLMKCSNSSQVSESDKRSLQKQGPLERPNLKYLLYEDPELKSLVYNKSDVAVFVGFIEHSFGLIHRSPEQIVDLHEQITNFQNVQNQAAVLVLFVGAVNHWVAVVLHK